VPKKLNEEAFFKITEATNPDGSKFKKLED